MLILEVEPTDLLMDWEGCLMLVMAISFLSTSSHPQGLSSQASTGQPSETTDSDSPLQKTHSGTKGRAVLPKYRKAWRHGWGVCMPGMEWLGKVHGFLR